MRVVRLRNFPEQLPVHIPMCVIAKPTIYSQDAKVGCLTVLWLAPYSVPSCTVRGTEGVGILVRYGYVLSMFSTITGHSAPQSKTSVPYHTPYRAGTVRSTKGVGTVRYRYGKTGTVRSIPTYTEADLCLANHLTRAITSLLIACTHLPFSVPLLVRTCDTAEPLDALS